MTVRLTKIIATLGPGTGTKVGIKRLVQAGVDVFRLNLSHGSHEMVRRWIRWIREVEKDMSAFVGILLDLQGPKIRVGEFEEGSIQLKKGQKVVLSTKKGMGHGSWIPVQYRRFHKEVEKGSHVYLDDGNLCVRVNKISGREVFAEVRTGGKLSNFKGINLPDTIMTASPLTPKDKKDLEFGLKEGVDFVALSFVGAAADIVELRRLIHAAGKETEIIAKIERKRAVDNLEEIVEASDGVMVARGDLGIEIPFAEVPVVQQQIMRACTRRCKPVIVATQMLESMISHPRPTRAEVSDISNSVMYCADAIMLSGETAVGKYPKAAVDVMKETALITESFQNQSQRISPWNLYFEESPTIHRGIAYSANSLVEILNAKALVVFTLSGMTAKMISSHHPMVPIFAFTSDRSRARRLTLLRGTVPLFVEKGQLFLDKLDHLFQILKKRRWVKKKDRVVLVTGVPVGIPKKTNAIRVEEVP